jgi:hypothetical protein
MSATARHRRSSRIKPGSVDGRHPKSVLMPPASYGLCRVRNCGIVGELGAGLCQYHWDQGSAKHDKHGQ